MVYRVQFDEHSRIMESTSSEESTLPVKMALDRTVRFSDENEILYIETRGDFTPEEAYNYWCSAQDFHNYRVQYSHTVLAQMLRTDGSLQMLDAAYGLAQDLVWMNDPKLLEETFLDPSPRIMALEQWIAMAGDARGLERLISLFHRHERGDEALHAAHAVLLSQTQPGSTQQTIADAYARESLISKVYARMLGQADYRLAFFDHFYPEKDALSPWTASSQQGVFPIVKITDLPVTADVVTSEKIDAIPSEEAAVVCTLTRSIASTTL